MFQFGSHIDSLEADVKLPDMEVYIGMIDPGPVKSATPQFLISSEATTYLSTAICISEGFKLSINEHDSLEQEKVLNI